RLFAAERSQHQLPAPVVLCSVDGGGVAQALIALEQQHHRQHRRRTRVLPSRLVRLDERLLESVPEQLASNLPEEPIELARCAQPASYDLLALTLDWRSPAHPVRRSRTPPGCRSPYPRKRIGSLVFIVVVLFLLGLFILRGGHF